MRKFLLFLFFIITCCLFVEAQNKVSYFTKKGLATQLVVNNTPFLVLGGELGNSSASSAMDIENIFPKLERMGLNTVLVPAYWDLIEAEEGNYNFDLIDKTISQAHQNNLKVVFLWFGAWKIL